ncbi:unnamed protein product [Oikopleura dioica]|uniref:Uncharacterized protein n=1 Tax=Oikopleura dioica TaxID=34765 RepID=E4YQP0_OIKDI|nr:unnamed protein product [Oikopleura dioica]
MMYFSIACREEPDRSLRATMAAATITLAERMFFFVCSS